ncbi:LysR family transcriptional regulator [Amycolatopsis sp. NPDC051903]|uniref:LysR family transcriptional regulator n=1 Tax=Amycolatopsis sp. NPDC051903 TaxID=3363936 RepID=UPI003789DABD
MDFSFGQLEGFVAVAEEQHFGRAAARLSMTQPPLSRLIQKLEHSVGVQLFDRGTRGARLTRAGEAFLVDARRLLALAGRAPDRARRVAAGTAGFIRIGFTGASVFGVLDRVLSVLAETLPEVHVELSEMVTNDQVDALSRDEIDLGLARPPFDTDAFASRLVHREPLVLCVPAQHRLATPGRRVTAADLANEPLIMYAPDQARYFYDLVIRLLPIAHRNVVHTVSQIQTMIWLVAARNAIAFVPASATRMTIEGVAWAELDGPDPSVELHLLWPRVHTNPVLVPALQALEPLVP